MQVARPRHRYLVSGRATAPGTILEVRGYRDFETPRKFGKEMGWEVRIRRHVAKLRISGDGYRAPGGD